MQFVYLALYILKWNLLYTKVFPAIIKKKKMCESQIEKKIIMTQLPCNSETYEEMLDHNFLNITTVEVEKSVHKQWFLLQITKHLIQNCILLLAVHQVCRQATEINACIRQISARRCSKGGICSGLHPEVDECFERGECHTSLAYAALSCCSSK